MIDGEDETIAELEMIVGYDDDLAGEATRVANRLHGLLTQIHPSLERVLRPRLQHPAVLTLLERFGSPAQSPGCLVSPPAEAAAERPQAAGHSQTEQLGKGLVECSGDPMDRRPDRRIVDNSAEVGHLELLQPVLRLCRVDRHVSTRDHPYLTERSRRRDWRSGPGRVFAV